MDLCIGHLTFYWDKIPDTGNLEEKQFILAQGLQGFSSWLPGFKAEIKVEKHSKAKLLSS